MTRPSGPELRHITSLDGLRGLAACIVLVSHISNLTNLWNELLGAGGGQIGVMLFFVLSGYLMGALYLDHPFTLKNVWNYAVHRIARVVPLFYLVIVLAMIIGKIGDALHVNLTLYDVGNVFNLFFFIKGTDVFWTIPVEVQFYAMFTLIWWLNSKSKILTIFVLMAAVPLMIHLNIQSFSRSLLFHLAFFLSGALISRWFSLNSRAQRAELMWSAGFVAAFVFAFLLFPQVNAWLFNQSAPREIWHDSRYLLAISACLIMTLNSNIASAILGNKIMSHLGQISYSIYLLHIPVILSLDRFTPSRRSPELFLLIAFVLVIALASVTHKYFERPTQRYLNRLLASKNLHWFRNLEPMSVATK
jgi:peptidoglycan/LPS O-acetylase OafA/YrhL